jgi:triphosphoribosyl-dephospho-CoA synthase
MQARDFIVSARASVTAMTEAGIGLGERIYRSIAATRDAVGINTNLGIVLLGAPLLQAACGTGASNLRDAVRRVLDATTVADADFVYRAIRFAAPAGLGRCDAADVRDPAVLNLRDSMLLAAHIDLIAAQYANGFTELFDVAIPHLVSALQRWNDTPWAVTDLYLYLLSRFEDSHVVRKHGRATAGEIKVLARSTYDDFLHADSKDLALNRLDEADVQFKTRGVNPGTTADFCVASLLLHRLLAQPAHLTGKFRSQQQTLRPTQAEVSQVQTNQ